MIRRATVRLIAALRRVAGSRGDVAFTVAVGAGYAVLFAIAFLFERGFRDDAVAGSASRSSQVLGFAFYAAVFVGVTVLYGCLLLRLHERGVERDAWWLMLGIPVGLHVALWATPPLLSIDLLSYVGHGYISAAGGNPYRTPVAVLEGRPFGNELASYGWAPSAGVTPYGPLWTDIEAVGLHLTHGVRASFLFLKAVTTVASLGTAVVIWLALRGLAPSLQRLATVAWLWNPVVLAELPGEGHNDVVMAFFAVAALALLVRGHPVASGLSLSLAVPVPAVPRVPATAKTACRLAAVRGRARARLGYGGRSLLALLGWHGYVRRRPRGQSDLRASIDCGFSLGGTLPCRLGRNRELGHPRCGGFRRRSICRGSQLPGARRTIVVCSVRGGSARLCLHSHTDVLAVVRRARTCAARCRRARAALATDPGRSVSRVSPRGAARRSSTKRALDPE